MQRYEKFLNIHNFAKKFRKFSDICKELHATGCGSTVLLSKNIGARGEMFGKLAGVEYICSYVWNN